MSCGFLDRKTWSTCPCGALADVAVIDTQRRELVKMIDGVGEEPWGATMVGAINYCH